MIASYLMSNTVKLSKAQQYREASDRAITKHDLWMRKTREKDEHNHGGLTYKNGQTAAYAHYPTLLTYIDAASIARHTSFSETIKNCQWSDDGMWKDLWYAGYVEKLADLLRRDDFEVKNVIRFQDRETNSHTLKISW